MHRYLTDTSPLVERQQKCSRKCRRQTVATDSHCQNSSICQDFKPSECKIIIHSEPRRYKKHEMQINLLASNEHQ